MKKITALVLALCLMLTGAAVALAEDFSSAVSTAQGTEIADTLRVVFKMEPSNLFAPNNTEIFSATIERLIYNTLITRNEKQEFVGELAESWEYIDDCTVRFHLVHGVTFSNGDELTSEDVDFSIMYNSNESSKSVIYGLIDHCECIDPYTVDIVTKAPNAALFSNLAIARTSIFSKKVYEEIGPDAYGRAPIGSGPYTLTEWVTGSSITVTKRNDYWGPAPIMEHIVFKPITESANRSIELETDGCDILIDPEPNDLPRLADEGYNVMKNKSYAISQIEVSERTLDENARKALAYALDYEALTDAVYGDMAIKAKGYMVPIMISHVENWNVEYNPEYAKELLKQSSLDTSKELQLIVPNDTELSRIAEYVQFYWKEIGVNVAINMADQASIRDRGTRGDFDVQVSSSSWTTGDPSRPTNNFRGNAAVTRIAIDQETADRFEEKWQKALAIIGNDEERIAAYVDLQQDILDQWVFFPIAHKDIAYVTTNKVDNFYAEPSGSPYLGLVTLYK